jgi:hypothetical protein
VREFRRYLSRVAWCVWIVALGLVGVMACTGHPAIDDQTYSPLHSEASSPTPTAHDHCIIWADDGTFPLPPQLPSHMSPSLGLTSSSALMPDLFPHPSPLLLESIPPTIPYNSLLVLRL